MKSLKLLLLLRATTVLSCLFSLVILGGLAGCSEFIVSICEIDNKRQGCFGDSGMAEARPKDMASSDMLTSPDPPRKFEWRAKINNGVLQSFVGIDKRQYAIFLVAGTPGHFEAVKFRFELPANMSQLEFEACNGCPDPRNIKLFPDYIFLTGEAEREFWLLRYGSTNKSYILRADGTLDLRDNDLDPSWILSWNPRPFFHPVLKLSSIAMKPSITGGSSLVTRLPKNGGTIKYGIERPTKLSAQAIGDLDSVELRKNGLDIINIGNNSIESVLHYDTEANTAAADDVLRGRINDAVNETKRSGSALLEAAYIENLNDDNYIDFIYSWSGRIHVASYTGNWTGTGSALLQNWGKEVVTVPAGETIRSIMALDLTKDGFPELIVETDKFVHFYLNTP